MATNEKLLFWPGKLRASLVYLKWDEESSQLLEFIARDQPTYFTSVGDRFFLGERALELANYNVESEISHIFSKKVKLFGAFDVIDSAALIINHLMTELVEDVQKQFGHEIPETTDVLLVDFENLFAGKNNRLSNIMKSYLGRNVAVFDAAELIRQLNKSADADNTLWVFADDAIDGSKISGQAIVIVDALNIFESASSDGESASILPNQYFQSLFQLIDKSADNSVDDWYQVTVNNLQESGNSAWVVDKRHLLKMLADSVSQASEKIGAAREIKVVGLFSNAAVRAMSHITDQPIERYDRERFIKLILKHLQDTPDAATTGATKVGVSVNSEVAQELELKRDGSATAMDYTLKLFGRKSELLAVTISDDNEVFMQWEFKLRAKDSIDICDIGLKFSQTNDGYIDCAVEPSKEIFLVSKVSKPMAGDLERPVDAVLDIVAASS